MPLRRDGVPTLVNTDGRAVCLQRLPLGERQISEGWLQQRLCECPEILPVGEIEPAFAPLVSIGCEIGTDVGPMDNLYVSPQGLLTVVEAKLWRNPQARREVVGQIIDYAKEIARWSYEDLDAKAREASGRGLYDLVSFKAKHSLDETRFVDAVSRNMRAGRFLLLIAGDGIREEMERLTEFLHTAPQLRFTLALIELQLYRLPDDDRLLVMPIIVGRTTEIVRAVVHVVSTEGAQVQVSLDIREDAGEAATTAGRKLTYDTFFEDLATSGVGPEGMAVAKQMCADFGSDPRFVIVWGTGSYILKLRDPVVPSCLYSVLVVQRTNWVWMDWLADQLERMGVSRELGRRLATSLGGVLGRGPASYDSGWEGAATLDELVGKYDQMKALILKFADDVHAQRMSDAR